MGSCLQPKAIETLTLSKLPWEINVGIRKWVGDLLAIASSVLELNLSEAGMLEKILLNHVLMTIGDFDLKEGSCKLSKHCE